jgi:hypothetical protein
VQLDGPSRSGGLVIDCVRKRWIDSCQPLRRSMRIIAVLSFGHRCSGSSKTLIQRRQLRFWCCSVPASTVGRSGNEVMMREFPLQADGQLLPAGGRLRNFIAVRSKTRNAFQGMTTVMGSAPCGTELCSFSFAVSFDVGLALRKTFHVFSSVTFFLLNVRALRAGLTWNCVGTGKGMQVLS